MAELYTFRPLFPGSSEIDQLFKICSIMGTPDQSNWPEGYRLSAAIHFQFPDCQKVPLPSIVTKATTYGLQLLEDMLQWDPERRPTAQQAMKYPFFEQAKRPNGNMMTQPKKTNIIRTSHLLHQNPVPIDYLLMNNPLYYQSTHGLDDNASLKGSNLSYSGSNNVATMNTINDILNNLHLNGLEAGNVTKKPGMERQTSKEKINELLLLSSSVNNAHQDVNKNNNSYRKGFFLHQPSTFPDSGIGDEELEVQQLPQAIKVEARNTQEVPVVVHKWNDDKANSPPKRRLSNLSLMAKITPLSKWDLYDDGVDGGDENDEEEDDNEEKHLFSKPVKKDEDDELGRILGSKIRSRGKDLDRKSQMYQKSLNSGNLDSIFGPISIEREVSPSAHPNTVPSVGKSRAEVNGNFMPTGLFDSNQNHQQHHQQLSNLSAYPPGGRRQENVLYNKNRDLSIKPSPYGLSTNLQLFPWGDRERDTNRGALGTNWIFDKEGTRDFYSIN